MTDDPHLPLTPLDYHVLVVLAEESLYGYAIMKAVEKDSGGVLAPEIGSLYRVLARLQDQGLLTETAAPADAPNTQRGRPRRYYRITPKALSILHAETERLGRMVARARSVLAAEGRP